MIVLPPSLFCLTQEREKQDIRDKPIFKRIILLFSCIVMLLCLLFLFQRRALCYNLSRKLSNALWSDTCAALELKLRSCLLFTLVCIVANASMLASVPTARAARVVSPILLLDVSISSLPDGGWLVPRKGLL